MMKPTAQQVFWQTIAQALQQKKSLPAALACAREAVAGDPLAEVACSLIRLVEAGVKLSQAMTNHPEAFEPRVMAAVDAGEATANLAEVAAQIAEAVEKGDAAGLPAAQGISEQAKRWFGDVILQAVRSSATDIAFEPREGNRMRIRQRIDGVLHDMMDLPEGSASALAMRIKAMAAMDVTQRRLPQDGHIALRLNDQDLDMRVSVVPTHYGERVTARVFRRQALQFDLANVGLNPQDLATARRFCNLPQGIVVVNGPTGCGKTALLYSMLHEMDQQGQAIFTVEDPVEVAFDRISQTQIAPEIGLTFAKAIRSFLRQSPDVIMVGELRDRETLELAVQAAMTGHLILTTLHANTSPAGIRRMLDIGLAPFMLNAALAGLISMRLIRLLCPQCKQPAELDQTTLPPEARQILRQYQKPTWYAPKGCPACSNTGYAGRTAVYEVLVMNDALRQAVLANAQTAALRQVALDSGMKTMLEDGLSRAAAGLTSVEEILRVVPAESYQ